MSDKPHFLPEARGWNKKQLAAYLGRSVEWLRTNERHLIDEGMPEFDRLLGVYDSAAIQEWWNQRSDINDDPIRLEQKNYERQLENGSI
jgi:hypothetical protein